MSAKTCGNCGWANKLNGRESTRECIVRGENMSIDDCCPAHKPIIPADPRDTAMLDWVLAHCTCIKAWKTGRDAFESREENKPLRTREDVRRKMEGLWA